MAGGALSTEVTLERNYQELHLHGAREDRSRMSTRARRLGDRTSLLGKKKAIVAQWFSHWGQVLLSRGA